MFYVLGRRYSAFSRAWEHGPIEEAIKARENMLVDLYAIQAHLTKLQASAMASCRESKMYEDQQQQLRDAISKSKNDIKGRKSELENARIELQRQREYEKVKEEIVRIAARSVTSTEMAAVDREIHDLNSQKVGLEEAIVKATSQLDLLIETIDNVYNSLKAQEDSCGLVALDEINTHNEQRNMEVDSLADIPGDGCNGN